MPIAKYEGKTFERVAFVVEESFFVNCVLKECDLFFAGGDSEWINTSFQNCRWHWRGPAVKTIQMLTQLGILKQSPPPPSFPASSSKLN
jgi:hypothetical protein